MLLAAAIFSALVMVFAPQLGFTVLVMPWVWPPLTVSHERPRSPRSSQGLPTNSNFNPKAKSWFSFRLHNGCHGVTDFGMLLAAGRHL